MAVPELGASGYWIELSAILGNVLPRGAASPFELAACDLISLFWNQKITVKATTRKANICNEHHAI